MPGPDDPQRRKTRRHGLVAGAVVLVLLFAALELMLLRSYTETGATTTAFSNTTETTTSIANVQREALRMQVVLATLHGSDDAARIELGRALLSRQLSVLESYAVARPSLRRSLAELESRLARFDRLFRSARSSRSALRAAAPELTRSMRAAELVIKQSFDEEEHALFGALAVTLHQRQVSQLALAGLGGFALLFAFTLAMIIRRAVRKDFTRAYRALAREVDERKALETQLREQATRDPLTGLGNRLHFQSALERALHERADDEPELAVLYLDLDSFKEINDMFGHDAGDEVLLETARRLVDKVRSTDVVTRLGGDEFAIILRSGLDAEQASELASRLVSEVSRPTIVHGHEVRVGASAGLAFSGSGGVDASDLVRNADLAMYVVKNGAKGSVRIFAPEMRTQVSERRQLELDLRIAIRQDGLRLHYQPVVDLDDGHTIGMEALVRWPHHERGMLQPADFLPVAEELGLMVELGGWVLRRACFAAREWVDLFPDGAPWVSVNVAPSQLQHPELFACVERALRDSGLAADRLVLEISEMVMLAEAQSCIGVLERLRGLGVRIALDDFGTGYASLSYLRFLPLDILKLDRCFLEPAAADTDGENLTGAILRLAESIGLTIIAEGIETAAQLESLRSMGSHLGQGFHMARPMPQAELGRCVRPLLEPAVPPLAARRL